MKFLINGTLLTLSSFFLQAVDSVFQIFLSGKVGAAGIGLFQLVLSVYRFAVTVSLSGVSFAATRIVAEKLATGDRSGARRAAEKCVAISLFFGGAAGGALFFGAPFFAANLLGDPKVADSLRILAVSLPFLAVSSCFCGYFTAVRRAAVSIFGHISGSFLKITATVYLLTLLLPGGLYSAVGAVSVGIVLAEAGGFFVLLCLYLLDRRRLSGKPERHEKKQKGGAVRSILSLSFPVALAAYIRSALFTVEQLLIPWGFRKNGKSPENALAQYGMIRGMVFPVIFLPSALIYSFSGLLVPELTECQKQGRTERIEEIVSRVFRITLQFSIGVSGFLLIFAKELSHLFYNNQTCAPYLSALAPLAAVMYFDGATDNLLKGLGQQMHCMRVNIVDSALSLLMVATLLPLWGVAGYIVVAFAGEMFNTYFSVRRLIKVTRCRIDLLHWIIKPIFFVFSAAATGNLIIRALPGGFSAAAAVSQIVFSILIYAVLLFMFKEKNKTKKRLEKDALPAHAS